MYSFTGLDLTIKVCCIFLMFQVSVDAVRELDRKLFEAYIERRADPIAGSLEPGIYAGYFDWRDCQTPTGTVLHGLTGSMLSDGGEITSGNH